MARVFAFYGCLMTDMADSSRREGEGGRGDMLDLTALWAAIRRRRFWIIAPTLAVAGLTLVAVNVIPPRYTGEARLLLENRDSFYTRPGQNEREVSSQQFDSEGVQSQVQVIMSRDLAREAIKRIGLVGNPEFDAGAGALNALKKLGVLLGLGSHPAERSPEERVLETYYDRLLVYPVGRSRIVAVEFTSRDPALAAKGANDIAATYLEMQEAAKQDTARSASSWLSTTIDPLRQRVSEAEAKVEEFRARNGLLVGTNNTTIGAQQLSDLTTQLSNARAQQAESQAKAGIIRDAIRQGRTFEIPDVANNELVRRLIEQRVNLRAQIAAESRNLLSEHPRIKELNAQLADLEGQIRAAAERTVRTLENEAKIAGQRVESFTAALDGQKKNVATGNDSDVQLRALEREARTLREQLEQYMQRYREAIARDAQHATPADARIVSRAIEPTVPSFPKKLPTVLVATLATFLVSLATIVSRELLSGQAAPVAPRRAPGWVHPAAMAMPTEEERSERVAGLLTHGGRTDRLTLDRDRPDEVLAALSSRATRPAPGRAPFVLGHDAAGSGFSNTGDVAEAVSRRARCVFVDLSGTTRSATAGFSELLSGEALFSDIITRAEGSRLHRIGTGRAGLAAVLAAPDLVELALDALCETYDWVFVGLPSSASGSAVAPMLARSQAVLVMAGQVGNGHAVEVGYRLADASDAPVTLVLDAEAPVATFERHGRDREPV